MVIYRWKWGHFKECWSPPLELLKQETQRMSTQINFAGCLTHVDAYISFIWKYPGKTFQRVWLGVASALHSTEDVAEHCNRSRRDSLWLALKKCSSWEGTWMQFCFTGAKSNSAGNHFCLLTEVLTNSYGDTSCKSDSFIHQCTLAEIRNTPVFSHVMAVFGFWW